MNAAQMYNRIDTFSDKECGSGANEKEIIAAETMLGVHFSESYRSFLRRVGWGRFSHQELYGLGVDVPSYLDLVKNTLAERNEMSPPLPLRFVPVMNDGAGNHFCLDTLNLASGECPIVFWDHEQGANQTPEVVRESFDVWLIGLLSDLS